MRKTTITVLVLSLILANAAYAGPTINFTSQSPGTGWTITKAGSDITMIFQQIGVSSTIPGDAALLDDEVVMPTMKLLNPYLANFGPVKAVIGTLVPIGDGTLLINDPALGAVMQAQLGAGEGIMSGLMTFTSTYIAYDSQQGDLTNISTAYPGYSPVVDGLVSAGGNGFMVDFSFASGNTSGLFNLLMGSIDGSQTGTLSGQISAIGGDPSTVHVPAPGAIILSSVGIGLVGWLRRRRSL